MTTVLFVAVWFNQIKIRVRRYDQNKTVEGMALKEFKACDAGQFKTNN